MASRRVAVSSIDWAEFAKKIPAAQKPAFQALKNKQDGYVRKIAALPETLPKIDFANYKSKIQVAGMVDNFQKNYDALQIPYPKDTASAAIDQQAVQQKADFEKFVAASKTRIAGFSTEIAKWQAMKPVEEMTLEEAMDSCPEVLEYNPNKPTFWPHDEDYDEWVKFMDEEYKEDAH